jgi:hypothetical protein
VKTLAPNAFTEKPRELADVLKDLDDSAAEAISMLQKASAHGSTAHPDHAEIVGILMWLIFAQPCGSPANTNRRDSLVSVTGVACWCDRGVHEQRELNAHASSRNAAVV